jgi:LysM repeat protein
VPDDATDTKSDRKNLLKRIRQRYKVMKDADGTNRRAALEDLKFLHRPGEQWEPQMRKKRGKPEVHVVRRGESIWTIARRNNMDPRTLMRLNGKSAKDKLRPGERLVLSGAGGGGGKAAASGGSKVTHRVRSGETLYSIARRYGVTIAQIVSWNGLSANRTLRIGQRLTIRTKRS